MLRVHLQLAVRSDLFRNGGVSGFVLCRGLLVSPRYETDGSLFLRLWPRDTERRCHRRIYLKRLPEPMRAITYRLCVLRSPPTDKVTTLASISGKVKVARE